MTPFTVFVGHAAIEVISPLAMGVWRATVILPTSAIAQLQPEALEAVLAHELAHVRRAPAFQAFLAKVRPPKRPRQSSRR